MTLFCQNNIIYVTEPTLNPVDSCWVKNIISNEMLKQPLALATKAIKLHWFLDKKLLLCFCFFFSFLYHHSVQSSKCLLMNICIHMNTYTPLYIWCAYHVSLANRKIFESVMLILMYKKWLILFQYQFHCSFYF